MKEKEVKKEKLSLSKGKTLGGVDSLRKLVAEVQENEVPSAEVDQSKKIKENDGRQDTNIKGESLSKVIQMAKSYSQKAEKHVYISSDLKKNLDKIAFAFGLPMNALVSSIMVKFIEENREEIQEFVSKSMGDI